MSESRRSNQPRERSRLAYTIDIPLTPPIAAKQEAVGKKRGRQRRVLLDTDAFLPSQTQPMPSKSAPLNKSAEIERIPFAAPILQPVNTAKEMRIQKKRDELEATLDLFNFESFDALGINVDDEETNPATKKMIETLELIYGLSDSLIKQIDPNKDENQLFDDAHIKMLLELKNVVHALIPLHVKNTPQNQQKCAATLEDFRVAISEYNSELTLEIREHAQLVANHVSGFITQKQHQLKPTQIEERGTNMASPRPAAAAVEIEAEVPKTLKEYQDSFTNLLIELVEASEAKKTLAQLKSKLDPLHFMLGQRIIQMRNAGLDDAMILNNETGQQLVALHLLLAALGNPADISADDIASALEGIELIAKSTVASTPAAVAPAVGKASASSSSDDDSADNSSESDAEEENVAVDENKSAAPSALAKAAGDDLSALADEIQREVGGKMREGDPDSRSESSSSSSSSSSKKSGEKKAAVEEKKAAKDESESHSGDEGTSSAADDELLSSEDKTKTAEPVKAAEPEAKKPEETKAAAAPGAKEDKKPEPAKAAEPEAKKAESKADKPAEPAKAAPKAEEEKKPEPAKAEKKEKLKVKEEAKPAMESESESSEAKKSASTKDDESTHEEESTATTEERTPAKRTKMPAMDDDETPHRSKAKEKLDAIKKSAEEFKDSAKDKAEKFFNKFVPKRERTADEDLAAFSRGVLTMQASALKSALSTLATQIEEDLNGKKEGRAKENSSAAQLLRDTIKMVDELTRTPNDGEFKDDAQYQKHLNAKVNAYKRTFSTSGFAKFGKAIAAVAIALGSLIAGAVIGGGIGIAAGAWTGPGAVVTGVAGVFTGAATGAGIGLVAGATAVGITAGTVSGIFLFKKPSEAARQRHDLAKKVAEEAREQAKTLKSG